MRVGIVVHHRLFVEVGVVIVGTQVEDVFADGEFVAHIHAIVPSLFAQVIALEV